MPPRRPVPPDLPRRPQRRGPPLDVEEAARLVQKGVTAAEIARRSGFKPAYVRLRLREIGVELRSKRSRDAVPQGQTLYEKWVQLRNRCRRASAEGGARWAGRGIRLSAAWGDFWAFYDWAIASGYRPGLYLDAIDGAREASPATCRWLTRAEWQSRTGPRAGKRARMLTAFGETKSVPEWERDPRCQVTRWGLYGRLQDGLWPEDAITTPPGAPLPTRRVRRKSIPAPRYDADEIVRLHVEERLSAIEISERIGATRGYVRTLLNRRGVFRSAGVARLHGRALRTRYDGMVKRCTNQADPNYHIYGGKGVRVCKAWLESFAEFHAWALRSGYQPGQHLHRRKGTRVYQPSNCFWSEAEETWHLVDRRRTSARPPRWVIAAFGERKGPTQWSRDPRCKVTVSALSDRIQRGMDAELAITTPPATPGGSRSEHLVTAWNETKSLAAWIRDRRCRVTYAGLRSRLLRGVPAELAITTPPFALHRSLIAPPPARPDRSAGEARAQGAGSLKSAT